MLRVLPALIELTLLIYCLIDAIQTPEAEMRNLSKLVWIVLILFIPLIGPIVWLVAGRPQRGSAGQVPWPSARSAGHPQYERPRVVGPDDDPDFLREMKRGNDEQEQLLSRWEEDLRRREQQLKPPSDEPREDGPEGAPTADA